ncbi:uncharacterized protein LOC114800987 [Denticeps clupeoides]|uniref:uncharacterized protein LOC114800987 n=1 Tax=Denticeps clupeoides TaxID=299321 RepID=UPI0010A2AD74|nr:uncharacterized protein LOC114800987 [Denticeps clupeoides]
MDAARICAADMRSHESLSLSDLDRGFVLDPSSSMLAAAVEPSSSRLNPTVGVVVEYSGSSPTIVTPLAKSPSVLLSPSLVSNQSTPLHNLGAESLGLLSAVGSKSSTPQACFHFKRPVLASSLNLSCIDLTSTHPSWEVSLIKPTDGSKLGPETSVLDSTWSPNYASAPPVCSLLGEISSLIGSCTPPFTTLSEGQRSWREALLLQSDEVSLITEAEKELQLHPSMNLGL